MANERDGIEQEMRKRMKGSEASAEDIMRKSSYMLDKDPFKDRAPTDEARHFRALFGVAPEVASIGWNMMLALDLLPEKAEIKHYLWALMYCKVYPTDKSAKPLTGGADTKTYKKWVGLMLDSMIELESYVIVWENRKKGDIGNDCLTGTDCTDFRIPGCGRRFASHKYNKKSALRYEVCISIIGGELVWINGPYECGSWPDISIFRNALKTLLEKEDGERTESDKGYFGECPRYCKCPGHITTDRSPAAEEQAEVVRSRTETINQRFKQWGVLRQCFRSLDFELHSKAFRAVAIHTQLAIQNGEPLFQVEYIDPYLNDLVYFEYNGYEGYEHEEEERGEKRERG